MIRHIDLTGQKFGRLTVLARSLPNHEKHHTMWLCRCDCGNTLTVIGYALRGERTLSCGCRRVETLRAMCAERREASHASG